MKAKASRVARIAAFGNTAGEQRAAHPFPRLAPPFRGLRALALAAYLLLLFAAASAQAAPAHLAGPFTNPQAVAVDPAAPHDIYVIDVGAGTLTRFHPDGSPSDFSAGPGAGTNAIAGLSFDSPSAAEIAIAPPGAPAGTAGDVYLADHSGGGQLDVYAPSGEHLETIASTGGETCGVATDPAGDLYVSYFSGHVDKYVPTTNPPTAADYDSQLTGLGEPCAIAASNATLYVSKWEAGPLRRYPTSLFPGSGGSHDASAQGTTIEVGGTPVTSKAIAVNPATDDLYIDEGTQVAVLDSTGNPLSFSPFASLSGSSYGVAAQGSGATARSYVSDAGAPAAPSVFSFGPEGVALITPDATTDVASEIAPTAAKLAGSVNPLGIQATYQFEYGTDASYGHKSPASPAVVGNDSAGHPESTSVAGLSPSTTYHFRIDAINENGTTTGTDQTFRTTGPPTIDGQSVLQPVAKTAATIEAQINPSGFTTSFRVKYGTEAGVYGSETNPVGIGSANTDQSVSAQLTGLTPATTYHYRVLATNSQGTVESSTDQIFTTEAILLIDSTSIVSLGTTATELQAQINPLGEPTTFHFEYGPTAAYGTSVPVLDESIGSANQDTTASAHIAGLSPDTDYHFRVVATNPLGTIAGPDTLFHTFPAVETGLPDGRVYEMVSPADKNGGGAGTGVDGHPFYSLATADGDSFLYFSSAPTGQAVDGVNTQYVARRSFTGWNTTPAIPRRPGKQSQSQSPSAILPSADLSLLLFNSGYSFAAANPDTQRDSGAFNLSHEGGPATWITEPAPGYQASPQPGEIDLSRGIRAFISGGSPDLSSIYFDWGPTLLPSDGTSADPPGSSRAAVAAADRAAGDDANNVGFYQYRNGVLSYAGVLPDGSINPYGASSPSPISTPAKGKAFPDYFRGRVSADGSRAFFLSPDPQQCSRDGCGGETPQLYVRITASDGTGRTELVTRSQLPGHEGEMSPSGPFESFPAIKQNSGSALFASADGSHAFFASCDALTVGAPTPPASCHLDDNERVTDAYDFDVNDESLTYLPGIDGPIVASTPNGSRFVFEDRATGELKLWRRENGGQITAVADLTLGETADHGQFTADGARFSADGDSFVFQSDAPIPGFNDAAEIFQVFRFDVNSAILSCLSCPPLGIQPTPGPFASTSLAGAHLDNFETNGVINVTANRGASDRGSRVFFDTPDPLVVRDTDRVSDVYEWEADGTGSCHSNSHGGGCIYLISSGTATKPSYFLDNSASGDDVFFTTAADLRSVDTDAGYDVYDARVGGGFPTEAPPEICEGEGCRGAGTHAPQSLTPGTATFQEPPKPPPAPPKCKRGFVKRHGRCVRRIPHPKKSSARHPKRPGLDQRGSR